MAPASITRLCEHSRQSRASCVGGSPPAHQAEASGVSILLCCQWMWESVAHVLTELIT